MIQETAMSPQQVTAMQRIIRNARIKMVLSIVLFVAFGYYLFVPEQIMIQSKLWGYIYVLFVICIFILMQKSGSLMSRDLTERIITIIHTPLSYKKYDNEDKEYELLFEDVLGDVDVPKIVYDQMQESKVYELHLAKHSKTVLQISDSTTGEVYFQK